jgi:hypothetical protein
MKTRIIANASRTTVSRSEVKFFISLRTSIRVFCLLKEVQESAFLRAFANMKATTVSCKIINRQPC